MKLFLATKAIALSVCTAQAATFTFFDANHLNDGSGPNEDSGSVFAKLTNERAGEDGFKVLT